MAIGERKVIDGKTYHLLADGMTKREAQRKATWQRRGQFLARVVPSSYYPRKWSVWCS